MKKQKMNYTIEQFNKEKELRSLLCRFYGNEDKVEIWLKKPHNFFDKKCPLELIESGELDKVLNWVKLCIE